MTESRINDAAHRLILGTVQLGMDYGIANTRGRPGRAEAVRIIETALAGGIRHFDTAQAYGESESVLGSVLRELRVSDGVFITSKLDARMNPANASEIGSSIERTVNRLQVDRLWCMMLHDPAWLARWDQGLGGVLRRFCDTGKIQNLGVSLKKPDDAVPALSCRDMRVIQAPCNAWDRRLAELGLLEKARHIGVMCCVRSIFLQGLLTMPPERVGAMLPLARDASRCWWQLADELSMPPKELAMRYALSLNAPLVVGVESSTQLVELLQLAALPALSSEQVSRIARAMDPVLDIAILEPYRWRKSPGGS